MWNLPAIFPSTCSSSHLLTQFLVSQLCGPFCGRSDYVELICPTFAHNKTLNCFPERDPRLFIIICEYNVALWLKVVRHQHSHYPWWLCSLKLQRKINENVLKLVHYLIAMLFSELPRCCSDPDYDNDFHDEDKMRVTAVMTTAKHIQRNLKTPNLHRLKI